MTKFATFFSFWISLNLNLILNLYKYYSLIFQANEDDDSDNEYSDDGMEETALESYQTPLDEDSCQVDEYQVFKNVLQSKCFYFKNFFLTFSFMM